MFQLKFSDDFKTIIEDIPYWKEEKDIPNKIIKFIKNSSNNIVLFDKSTNKYHCSECLSTLDNHFFCDKCNKKYNNFKDFPTETEKEIKTVNKIKYYYNDYCNFYNNYYVFDIINNHVILYFLTETVSYKNPFSIKITKYSKINITNIYLISENGLTDIIQNKYHSFDYNNIKVLENENATSKEIDDYIDENNFFWSYDIATLYLDNLEKLKSTIYKYSTIWKFGDYLNSLNNISLAQLTYIPIYCKQFEYLLKFRLYNLAFFDANNFKKGKNFKDIFGVDKKYLKFMREININYDQLSALRLHPTENIELIEFISYDIYISNELITKYNINIEKLKSYFDKNKLSNEQIYEYYDYIEMAQKLNLDLKDKTTLFPNDLLVEHDKLYLQLQINNDPKIDLKIKDFSKILLLNYYEDDKYIIIPATSLKDLVDESNQQSNCVRTYCERIANSECQIYFMRKKEEINKSFVTIEVRETKITQARTKYNKLPDKAVLDILNKWEKSLLPITTIKN